MENRQPIKVRNDNDLKGLLLRITSGFRLKDKANRSVRTSFLPALRSYGAASSARDVATKDNFLARNAKPSSGQSLTLLAQIEVDIA
jgi:hypothetical protein